MAGANLTKEQKLNQLSQTVGASATNTAVSNEFRINGFSRGFLRVDVHVSAITVATALSAKLQNHDGSQGSSWFDTKSVSLTATGWVTININLNDSGDYAYVPLRPLGRIVVTTGAGDTVTIDSILVYTEE